MKIYFGQRDDYFKPDKWWKELKDDIPVTAECNSIEDAFTWMKNYLKKNDFKSYYYRINISNNKDWLEVDWGSHYMFFIVYEITEEEFNDFYHKEDKEKC